IADQGSIVLLSNNNIKERDTGSQIQTAISAPNFERSTRLKSISKNAQSSSNLKVFPNPVTDKFTLEINTFEKGLARIIILNSTGAIQKQLQMQKVNSTPLLINISTSQLPSGNYIITAQIGNKVQSLSIVKIE
ncbi:MAG: T9SS type A sorting domain-containing protein, partial [Flavisolibacter sp.]